MNDTNNTTLNASPRNIAIATIVALVVSGLVLVTIILPAEFDIDPLGTGELLGLDALAGASDQPLLIQADAFKSDYAEFILEPFQSVEYKYLMDIDSSMVFNWQAETAIYFDFHGDPAGLDVDIYGVSFSAGEASEQSGTYHAPFTGIHGWFWENRGFQPVTIKLHSSGFYINSTVYQDGGSFERELRSVAD